MPASTLDATGFPEDAHWCASGGRWGHGRRTTPSRSASTRYAGPPLRFGLSGDPPPAGAVGAVVGRKHACGPKTDRAAHDFPETERTSPLACREYRPRLPRWCTSGRCRAVGWVTVPEPLRGFA